jgi:hypothetical protein
VCIIKFTSSLSWKSSLAWAPLDSFLTTAECRVCDACTKI